ncbi:MAG TPA: hypothetical protein VEB41_00950 [Burkholderiales bacterium]|nr:hypothetical protein [Burkholderiales bacterium]
MQLVQILLPLQGFSKERYEAISRELTERFGGVTTYSRAPASGLWKDAGSTVRDDIVVYEVMVDTLDRDWWGAYRRSLEAQFQQQEIVVRALALERL